MGHFEGMLDSTADKTASSPRSSNATEPNPSRSVRRSSPDDAALIDRVFAHMAANTTDLGPQAQIHEEPLAHYRDPERLADEFEFVLKPTWQIFCHSTDISSPGDYVARSHLGVPIFVVRDEAGQAVGYRNVCSHRGHDLVAIGHGCAKTLTCPYHGWSFDLQGRLRGVPHRTSGFPALDTGQSGLHSIGVSESMGLVWVRLSSTGPSLSDFLAGIDEQMQPIGLESMVCVRSDERSLPIHWKTLLESFLEGYHIRTTHPESIYPFGFDNMTVSDRFGHHGRMVFPYRRIESLRDRPREEWKLHRVATVVHHIFPTNLVSVNAMHFAVVSYQPVSPTETKFRRWILAPPEMVKNESEKLERDVSFLDAGLEEDYEAGARITSGLAHNPNRALRFGRFEGNIVHFLTQIDARIRAGRATADV